MRRMLSLFVTVGLLAASAAGQVYPIRTGRALDANFRVGSGGLNSIRAAEAAYGIPGNLIITGQVTRGFAFRGNVPYSASNELRLTLPSETIDNFNRDAVGLPQIQRGVSVYGPNPYFRPSSTVLGSAGIEAGLNAPGSSAPRTAVVAPTITPQQAYLQAIQAYRPVLAGRIASPSRVEAVSAAAAGAYTEAYRPQASELFGLLGPDESLRIARELQAVVQPLAEPAEPTTPAQAGLTPAEPTEGRPAQPEAPGASLEGDELRLPAVQAIPDDDVFTEMLYRLAERRSEAGQPAMQLPGEPLEGLKEPLPPQDQAQRADQKVILHSFAGRRADQFNSLMSRAETAMTEGNYYEAASLYDSAHRSDRSNPLAPLGAFTAYLAAGEPLTAGFFLSLALEDFPPLMEARVDLDRIVGPELLGRRIEIIKERMVAQPDQTAMVLLLTYIYHNQGQTSDARQYAHQLTELTRGRPALQAFAQYVLTGKRPTELLEIRTTTQPQ